MGVVQRRGIESGQKKQNRKERRMRVPEDTVHRSNIKTPIATYLNHYCTETVDTHFCSIHLTCSLRLLAAAVCCSAAAVYCFAAAVHCPAAAAGGRGGGWGTW